MSIDRFKITACNDSIVLERHKDGEFVYFHQAAELRELAIAASDQLIAVTTERDLLKTELQKALARIEASEQQEEIGYIYPWDVDRLRKGESFVQLFSIPVGCERGESTVKVYTHQNIPAPKSNLSALANELADKAEKLASQLKEGN